MNTNFGLYSYRYVTNNFCINHCLNLFPKQLLHVRCTRTYSDATCLSQPVAICLCRSALHSCHVRSPRRHRARAQNYASPPVPQQAPVAARLSQSTRPRLRRPRGRCRRARSHAPCRAPCRARCRRPRRRGTEPSGVPRSPARPRRPRPPPRPLSRPRQPRARASGPTPTSTSARTRSRARRWTGRAAATRSGSGSATRAAAAGAATRTRTRTRARARRTSAGSTRRRSSRRASTSAPRWSSCSSDRWAFSCISSTTRAHECCSRVQGIWLRLHYSYSGSREPLSYSPVAIAPYHAASSPKLHLTNDHPAFRDFWLKRSLHLQTLAEFEFLEKRVKILFSSFKISRSN